MHGLRSLFALVSVKHGPLGPYLLIDMVSLALSAARQLLVTRSVKPEEEAAMMTEMESVAAEADTEGKGTLTVEELYEALSKVEKLHVTNAEIFIHCQHLPKTKDGKVKIKDFMHLPILSEESFRAIDRNKDGYISKGELKLIYKQSTMTDISKTISELDFDHDNRINIAEYRQSDDGFKPDKDED